MYRSISSLFLDDDDFFQATMGKMKADIRKIQKSIQTNSFNS
jgi:hypothetical protein